MSQGGGSFWYYQIKGRKGQYALQIGASVGLMIAFVAIPTASK